MRKNLKYLLYDSKLRMILVLLIFIIAIAVNITYLRILTLY